MSYRFKKKFSKDKEFMSNKPKTDSGYPSKGNDRSGQYLADKAFKDLRFTGIIATKADPQTTATTASQPYAIIAATNRIKDANYPGEDNLAGNSVVQLMNSNNSLLMKNFDSGRINLKLNYLYANYDDNPSAAGKTEPYAVNKYIGAAINEALSRTNSEMYTNLPFAQYIVETKCAQMDTSNHAYLVLFYQIMLQNCATILGKYVELMSLEKHLIDMGYNRESYYTIELFGLLKKKAFVQKLNALSVFIQGEYFDQDWYRQTNILTLMPSRRSFSVRDPLLTLKSSHKLPNLTVKIGSGSSTTTVFNQDTFKVEIDDNGTKKKLSMEDLCEMITSHFDQVSVLGWARRNYMGTQRSTAIAYYNQIIKYIDAATIIMSTFSRHMSEVRTYLDVMNKLGLNNWRQGTTFDVSAINQMTPSFNMIVANVFKAYLASPEAITWDDKIQRWTFYSFWDEYTGINTYDRFTGGAFLTFSVRDLKYSNLSLDASELLIPRLFKVIPDSCILLNRSGEGVAVQPEVLRSSDIRQHYILSRILPLTSLNTDIRVPSITLDSSNSSPEMASAAYEAIQTVAGIGKVKYPTGDNIALDRDLISLIDIQMNDVANAMLTFCRAYSPFRVWIVGGSGRTIGFGSK